MRKFRNWKQIQKEGYRGSECPERVLSMFCLSLSLSKSLYTPHALYTVAVGMELFPAEKSVLQMHLRNLKIILANYETLNFADFQVLLSNMPAPLGYTRTNLILSILERYGAVQQIGSQRPKRYQIVKEKLEEIIHALSSGES